MYLIDNTSTFFYHCQACIIVLYHLPCYIVNSFIPVKPYFKEFTGLYCMVVIAKCAMMAVSMQAEYEAIYNKVPTVYKPII